MIYFFINMPLNEASRLEDRLPKGCYCLFQMQSPSSRYYGIMKKEAYQTLLESVSEETRNHIEVLDKDVFQLFFLNNISDGISYLGNRRLMVYLSDED